LIPGSKLFERISRMGDFCEDFFRRFGPDEGLGVGVVMVEGRDCVIVERLIDDQGNGADE